MTAGCCCLFEGGNPQHRCPLNMPLLAPPQQQHPCLPAAHTRNTTNVVVVVVCSCSRCFLVTFDHCLTLRARAHTRTQSHTKAAATRTARRSGRASSLPLLTGCKFSPTLYNPASKPLLLLLLLLLLLVVVVVVWRRWLVLEMSERSSLLA